MVAASLAALESAVAMATSRSMALHLPLARIRSRPAAESVDAATGGSGHPGAGDGRRLVLSDSVAGAVDGMGGVVTGGSQAGCAGIRRCRWLGAALRRNRHVTLFMPGGYILCMPTASLS